MPQYSGTYATPRVDIGGAFEEYQNSQLTLIGLRAMPLLSVDRESGTFSAITREALLRRSSVKRAADGGYNRDTFEAEDVTYSTEEKGLECKSDDSLQRKYANDFDVGRLSAQFVMDKILREQEIAVATALFNATTWSGSDYYTDNSAAPWSTTTTDVVSQINAARVKVFTLTGMDPRTLIISYKNALYLTNNDDLVGRATYTGAMGNELGAKLAAWLDLDTVLIGNGVYNSADEGRTLSMTNIWSDTYAMLALTAPEGAIGRTPCVGRCPLWTADSPVNVMVEQYRDERVRSDVYRVRQYTGVKVIDKSFAHLMKIA